MRTHIITALDIGSGSIKILAVSKKPEEESFEVLAKEEEISFGVRKGVVIDISKVSEIISSLKEKIEQDFGGKINSVYANIGGGHLFSISSRGLVSVSRADQKISEEDVERVLQAARTISLSSHNKEIIEVFPKDFIVDGEGGIKQPVGMQGVRLETDALALCGFSPYIRNLNQAISDSDFQLNSLIPVSLASSRAVLTPKEKELGTCVLDIGAGTTSLAVFEEENLIHVAVFPVGSANITNDLAICLKTDIDTAERIKLEFGDCRLSSKSEGKNKEEKKIKIGSSSLIENDRIGEEEPLVFSKKILRDIIGARVSEIFGLASKELKKISRQKLLPAGIVLTGGGAKLPGIKNLAKKDFKLPCRIGTSNLFPDFQNDPSLSTLCGLILEGTESEEEGSGNTSSFGKGILGKLKKIFSIFIP